MKYIIIIFSVLTLSNRLNSQTVVTSTNVNKTVEYSYDNEGKLIKNFSPFQKVIPDSVINIIPGTWIIKEYESWEKEKVDTIQTVIKFNTDSVQLIQGEFLNSSMLLNGIYAVMPNNAEGAEITISNIESSPKHIYKIAMYIIHCERNILFVSIMSFDSETSNGYNGMYKMIRQ